MWSILYPVTASTQSGISETSDAGDALSRADTALQDAAASKALSFDWTVFDPAALWARLLEETPAPSMIAGGLAGLFLLLLLSGIFGIFRRKREMRAKAEAQAAFEERLAAQNHTLETQLSELKGRLAALAEMSTSRQSELAQSLTNRLDRVSERLGAGLDTVSLRLGQSLSETSEKLGHSLASQTRETSDRLTELQQRLAVIDVAQTNLTELSSRVVSLQDVLANKQARGAFGQLRMETIVEDGLPRGAYSFQATLSNGTRPDALIHIPGGAGIAIDAKFPLEGFEVLRTAHGSEAEKHALARIRRDVGRHLEDISSKYLLPGETQDTALMFVPSEWIYAEIHERLSDVVQKAHRARVVIVSPNMLMLAVQTMQAILKDNAMREQAGVIQREVGHLMNDLNRLSERVRDLEKHFTLAAKDVEKILTSADKVAKRGQRIDNLDLAESAKELAAEKALPRLAAGE